MIVIADSNIFYSALIAPNGEIANILRDKNMQFIAPDFIIDEVKEHLDIIEASRKKDKTKKKILADLNYLLEKITIISLDKIDKEYLQEAFTIVKDIDEWDVYFVALHFKTEHKLWTGDKALISGLKNKGYEICVTTEDLKEHLYKKQSP